MRSPMTQLMELATGYWGAGALKAALETGLFGALEDGPATAAEAAARMGAAERQTAGLLTALTGLGLLTAEQGRYAFHPETRPYLHSQGERCLLGALQFNADLYPLWGQLAETVRTGRPAIPPGAHLGADPSRTRRFVLGMHSRALGLAPHLLPALPAPESGKLLDVGSGPGTFSRRLAEARPGLTVTQFDLPPVIEVARELTAGSAAADRIEFKPGNYRTDALGGPYDAALFSGAIHQEKSETARDVLGRILAAVRPGGIVIVSDLMLDPEAPTPVFAALFGLTMMLTSPEGGVHSSSQVAAWLKAAGAEDVRVHVPEDIPYRVVAGVVPASGPAACGH